MFLVCRYEHFGIGLIIWFGSRVLNRNHFLQWINVYRVPIVSNLNFLLTVVAIIHLSHGKCSRHDRIFDQHQFSIVNQLKHLFILLSNNGLITVVIDSNCNCYSQYLMILFAQHSLFKLNIEKAASGIFTTRYLFY